MTISSCSSCSSGSYTSQASSARAQSAQDEARRANFESNNSQSTVGNNIGANNSPAPTVNTNGHTVGRLINVAV